MELNLALNLSQGVLTISKQVFKLGSPAIQSEPNQDLLR